MGDLRASSPEPNGIVSPIGDDYWRTAEAATEGIINQVRPTVVSEERRKAVIDYVQRLIRSRVGCEVFPFGSVPLKTYLPDGDIDLTAVGGAIVEEVLANKVCSVLEREDQNDAAQFVVKDVQLIRAEVKLVKCLVQNIVVDISFNQLGGLSTLCFLEKVDDLIGKEHLFKRSIILIKAWCYYESRILGAHHGLISTYALETLVLYIFHVFSSSLNGPLAVLYKFLDYFSKFDWDNYCISLNGPVRISSLPEFVVKTTENGASDLLLSNDFLKKCVDMFSVPIRGLETNSRTFPPKHLNIVDPLKENNNLGRSVSKGNFFRIRSAFTYGARKLGRILSQPEENVADELRKFFANTLDRHGSGQRPDVHDHIHMDGQVFGAALQFQGIDYPQEDHSNSELESADSDGTVKDCKLDDKQYFYGGANAIVSERQMSCSAGVNDAKNSLNDIAIAETRLSGDAKDLATAKTQGFSISRNANRSSASSAKETSSPRGKASHAPHLYFSGLTLRNGEIRNGNPEWKHREGSGSLNEDSIGLVNQDHSQLISSREVMSPVGSTNHPLLSNSVAWPSEDQCTGHSCSHALVRPAERPDGTTSLADLCGDNESHLLSLYNSQCCYENTHFSSMSLIHPQLRRNTFHWMNVNGAVSRPYFPVNGPLIHGVGFGMEEVPKTRGTGTYFPNTMLQNHYRDRNYGSRGRNQGQMRSPRNNGRSSTFQERTSPEKISSHDASLAQYHGYQSGGKSGSSDHLHFGSAESKPYYNVNGSVTFPEKVAEHGSVLHLPSQGSPFVETSRHPGLAAPVHDSSISVPPTGMQKLKPLSIMDQDSKSLQSYKLKDDGDFPPLSDSSGKGSPVSMAKKVEKAEQ